MSEVHGEFTNTTPLLFSKFIIVGLSNTTISFMIFYAVSSWLAEFSLKFALSQSLSYITGMLWSYFWNSKTVFYTKTNSARIFLKFIFTQILLLVVSSTLIQIIITGFNTPPALGWFIIMSVITIINFIALKLWVFREN